MRDASRRILIVDGKPGTAGFAEPGHFAQVSPPVSLKWRTPTGSPQLGARASRLVAGRW